MAFIDAFPRMPWPLPNTSVFESSNTFSNRNASFVNDVEMEDISEEEAMDYEITSSEDFRDPVAQVRQVEEDEKFAILLQAQYDAEVRINISHLINGREQRSFSSASSSQRSQNHHIMQSLQEQVQAINLLLRTWTPFFNDDSYESLLQISIEIGEQSKGLEKRQINVLPTRKFSSLQSVGIASDGSDSQDCQDCSICLCEYKNEDMLRTLPCHHEFHVACIDKWLKSHNTCPICRTEISKQQFGRRKS